MARHRIIELVAPPVDFERDVADPDRWWATGLDLLATAMLIWPQVARGLDRVGFTIEKSFRPERAAQVFEPLRHRGPFYLLAGLAIENCLKAIIVARRRRESPGITSDALLKPIKTHDLVKLCKQAKIGLDAEETELLNRLTSYVVWAGRYPVSGTKAKTVGERATKVNDLEMIRRFLTRIGREFNNRTSAP